MATLLVTLEIEVEDYPLGDDEEPDEIPSHDDYEADEVADILVDSINPDMTAEMFGGTMVYAQFKSAKLINAEWKE